MEIPQWILGGLGGGFFTALVIAFRFGGVFTELKLAITSLNKMIEQHKEDHDKSVDEIKGKHEKHEEKNDVQLTALFKVADAHGKQIVILEHQYRTLMEEMKGLRK